MQITTMRGRAVLCLALGLLATGGCVYQMPIQQGNYPDAAAFTQVRPGMTRAQVRYLLGTPQVPGAFDNERWDYVYYLKISSSAKPRRAKATIYFDNDLVDRVESDIKPAPASAEAPVQVPAATPAAGAPPAATT